MHRIIQKLIPKSDINADRNLCPITAKENLVRFFFVLFQEEKIFSSHWLLALISCYPRISLTSAIASSRTVEIISVEQKSKTEMHPAGNNHPCGTKKLAGDASDWLKSSLRHKKASWGCIRLVEIIPAEQKS